MLLLQVLSAFVLVYLVLCAEFDCDPCICTVKDCNITTARCTIETTEEELNEIPGNFSTRVDILDLEGQPLKILKENVFQDANLNYLDQLKLGSCQISEIHRNAFFNMSKLKWLIMKDNQICRIDNGTFYWLKNLESLDLSKNLFEILPDFQNLTGILELYVNHNNISYLSENTFVNNTKLFYLDLSHNKIEILPEKIFRNLKELRHLHIVNNKLIKIPNNVFLNNYKLEYLFLQNNSLIQLSSNLFANLTNLHELDLKFNNITQLPKNVFYNMSSLKLLLLSFNKIEELQLNTFTNLSSLDILELAHNKIKTLKPGVFEYMKCFPDSSYFGLKIHLNNNNISSLPSGIFRKSCRELIVNFSFNNISLIDTNAFSDSNILTLNLSHNQISFLSKDTFKTPIKVLSLSFNSFTSFSSGIFNSITHYLDLKYNHIKTISSNWFGNTSSLILDLSNNDITYFDLNNKHFHKLNISENPIICDCKLRKQHEHLTQHEEKGTAQLECSRPLSLYGINWNKLKSDQFACEPNILDNFTETTEGVTHKIGCKVYGSPAPNITWIKNDKALQDNDTSVNKTIITLPDDVYWYNLSFSTNVSGNIAGQYICELSNAAGMAEMNFTVLQLEESTVHVGTALGITAIVIVLIVLHVVLVGFYFKRLKRTATNTDSNTPYEQMDETDAMI